MESLENLQHRIAGAFARIEAAAKTTDLSGDDSGDATRQLAESNVRLAAELDQHKARRAADSLQLDALINRLKPLINEVSNA